jgi:hypothetical protein
MNTEDSMSIGTGNGRDFSRAPHDQTRDARNPRRSAIHLQLLCSFELWPIPGNHKILPCLLRKKGNAMNMDPRVKPALWGAVGGAVVLAIVGFSWGGWKTAASTRDLVQAGSQKAVVVALAPLCVEKFNAQTDAAAKLGELKKLAGYEQGSFVEKAGWATFGSEKPNSDVARACADALTSPPDKAASTS